MFKGKSFKDYLRMLSFMKSRIGFYLTGIVMDSALDASMSVIIAFVLKDLMDAAVKGEMGLLVRAVEIISLEVLALVVLTPIFSYMYNRSVKQTMADIRMMTFRHIEELPVGYYENRHSGDLISRVTNDLNSMEQAYSWQARLVIFTIIFGAGSAMAMFLVDWRIALILVFFGIASALANAVFAAPLRSISDKIQKLQGKLTERLTDLLSGFHIIKMFNLSEIITGRYDETNNEVTKAALSRVRISAVMDSMSYVFSWVNFGGILAVGSFMILNGSFSFGKLAVIIQLSGGVNFMFQQLGKFVSWLQGSLAGANRIFELFDEPKEPERYVTEGCSADKACVVLENLSFSYDGDSKILSGLSLEVVNGRLTALVGPSGGGKSTVIKLLLGYYPVSEGLISINGKPMKEYTLAELRDLIAYVPQDAYLFDGTIEENIRYGKCDAAAEEIAQAARLANAHDFILEMPEGYDTLVGERGTKLSGGQKQRIAIARALLKNAPILLLDEATSALDSESENQVQDALNKLMKGRTVIAVAHRLSTIEHADVIFVIEDGKVVEQGSHSELTIKDGLYNQLYKLQFKQNEAFAG